MSGPTVDFGAYAQERLRAAMSGLHDDRSDVAVLADAELAVMALRMHYGASDPVTLAPLDVAEAFEHADPECICPPGLAARGGFRGGCPAHHAQHLGDGDGVS